MSDSIETRIADVVHEHRIETVSAEGWGCMCGEAWAPHHVAAEVVAALRLRELEELLAYCVDEPQGWIGEGREIAGYALDVLHGEPVTEQWKRNIAAAKAAGWERTE